MGGNPFASHSSEQERPSLISGAAPPSDSNTWGAPQGSSEPLRHVQSLDDSKVLRTEAPKAATSSQYASYGARTSSYSQSAEAQLPPQQPAAGAAAAAARPYKQYAEQPYPAAASWTSPGWAAVPSAPASFELAPMQAAAPLPFDCGVEWVIFILSFVVWPGWYVGALLPLCLRLDPRERPGWLSNVAMSFIFTLIWLALLAFDWHWEEPLDDDCPQGWEWNATASACYEEPITM